MCLQLHLGNRTQRRRSIDPYEYISITPYHPLYTCTYFLTYELISLHVMHMHMHMCMCMHMCMLIKSQIAGCAKRGLFVTFPTKGPHNRLFQRSKVLQHHTVRP